MTTVDECRDRYLAIVRRHAPDADIAPGSDYWKLCDMLAEQVSSFAGASMPWMPAPDSLAGAIDAAAARGADLRPIELPTTCPCGIHRADCEYHR